MADTDLLVLPHFAAHDAGEADLSTAPKIAVRVRPDGGVETGGRGEVADLAAVSGRENLAQALILRLLTPLGSLAPLGHPDYGSRLHELVGAPRDTARRHLCRAFVLAAIAREPRVEPGAVSLDFDPAAEGPDSLAFTLVVQPVAGGDPLALNLEVGA
ncbi:GPW/gp25 family protein [Phytomonospora sp. NPDC050363]|uniref:GPW/gp25 family protein n=1 Tax=Phytomonospora sp. NPDC050363 TaxID=3155642 RepID=UPI0033E1A1AA